MKGVYAEAARPSLELPIGPQFLTEIGRLITLWAYFENDFDCCLSTLMLHPSAKDICDIPTSFVKRAKFFRQLNAVAFGHHEPTRAIHDNIVTKALKYRSTRDFVAHGRWTPKTRRAGRKFVETGKLNVHLYKMIGPIKIQHQALSLDVLKATSTGIAELSAQLIALWSSHWGHYTIQPDVTQEIVRFKRESFSPLPTIDISKLNAKS